jgi:hypothetical protein
MTSELLGQIRWTFVSSVNGDTNVLWTTERKRRHAVDRNATYAVPRRTLDFEKIRNRASG